MLKKVLTTFAFLGALVVGLGFAAWYLPLLNKTPITVEIKPGDTLTVLAKQWEQEGWLPSALLLRIQAKVYGGHLKVGEYEIPKSMNTAELLPYLFKATPIAYRFTLIEGQNLQDALNFLSNVKNIEVDIEPLNVDTVGAYLNIKGSAEGWIYPDTYVYHKGDKVSSILRQAHLRTQQYLNTAWENRAENLPYQTPYEALIMASIVEKETGMADERERIAGVFVRRLQKNMRLETDPTVIYGLGRSFNGNLTRKHLQDRSNAWNTYRHFGLPPTPIALAGKEAIEAALNPAEGDELFFVARGDGSHQFSATLDAHNKAVRHYQITHRVKNYRSAPLVNDLPQENPKHD